MPSVTRTTQSNRSKRRDEIRGQLLVAVERLLAEGQGFTELSVERLATEAGVSRSTFYVYFEDKADLLRAWLASIISEVYQAAKAWWDLPDPVTKEDLRAALDHIVGTYRPHTTLMSAVLDASAYDGGVRTDFDRFMQRNIAGLRAHITDRQARGTIDPTLLAKETAAWLTWMAERGLHIMVAAAGDAELRRLITAYTDIIWNTLYAPTAARR
jgi:AcrR family transcriptional regulator